jgi:hypothetical protein
MRMLTVGMLICALAQGVALKPAAARPASPPTSVVPPTAVGAGSSVQESQIATL